MYNQFGGVGIVAGAENVAEIEKRCHCVSPVFG
jgi:hypothetical protein